MQGRWFELSESLHDDGMWKYEQRVMFISSMDQYIWAFTVDAEDMVYYTLLW